MQLCHEADGLIFQATQVRLGLDSMGPQGGKVTLPAPCFSAIARCTSVA